MRWIRELGTGTKLTLSFGVMALLILIAGSVGIGGMAGIRDNLAVLYERDALGVSNIKQAKIDVLVTQNAIRAALLDDSTERWYAEALRHEASFWYEFYQYRKTLTRAEDIDKAEEAQALFKELREVQDAVLNLVSAGAGARARGMWANLDPLVEALNASFDELSERKVVTMRNTADETRASYTANRNIVVGAVVAALAMATVLAVFVTRMIAGAIAALRQSLADLNANNAELVDNKRELERRVAEALELSQSNISLTSHITEITRLDRMKSEFVSMVSHELRTPLTSIRGSLGLLGGGVAGALPPVAKKLIDIATNNCERLIRLINDILDIEKIESGTMRFDLKPVELEPLIVQAIAANEGFSGQHGVSMSLVAGTEAMCVNADRDGLSQVVTNLLSNAVKFSPRGGAVEVRLTHAAGRVLVEVRDRGPGIPDEFISRIFQKFSQADSSDSRQKSGTGLGLNISKAIVERLGGTIGFTTRAGETTFYFELPEWRDAAADIARAEAHGPDGPDAVVELARS